MSMFDGFDDVMSIANFAGDLYENVQNRNQAKETRSFNAAEAQKNRDFQEQMRKTQYQTAVGDMKAAGLNPMLAYQQGGAGTPSGSTASGQAAQIKNPTSGAINTKLNSAMNAAQVEQLGRQNDLTRQLAIKAEADTDQAIASAAQIRANTGMVPVQIAELQQRIHTGMQGQELTAETTYLTKLQQELAKLDQDYKVGQIGQLQAQTRLSDLQHQLQSLGLPEAKNKADMEQGPWGKVRHYIPDAAEIANSAGNLAQKFMPEKLTEILEMKGSGGKWSSTKRQSKRSR